MTQRMNATTTIAISRENAFLLRTMGKSGESANEIFTRLVRNAAINQSERRIQIER
jgi:hypothetical protein